MLRIFTALEQARDGVKSAANSFHGQWRIPILLATQARGEEPESASLKSRFMARGLIIQHLREQALKTE